MQIKIEIDLKPEELRRFLGLPDVAGLQEDVIQFLREKVSVASETFDPASFVKDNLQTLRNSAPWRRIVAAARVRPAVPQPAAAAATADKAAAKPAVAPRKRRAAVRSAVAKAPAKRRAARKAVAAKAPIAIDTPRSPELPSDKETS